MRYFLVGDNFLWGHSDSFNFSSWNYLNFIDLCGNDFDGPIDWINRLPTVVRYITACNNYFSGHLPGTYFDDLYSLFLNGNFLSGHIPSLYLTPKLGTFDVHDNILSGPIPELGITVRYIELSNNLLTGPILTIPRSAYRFSVYGNHLTGSLPHDLIENATSLGSLIIADNKISGTISPLFFNGRAKLSSLQVLVLASNCFHGKIPSSICDLNHLETLHLDGMGAACLSSNPFEQIGKGFMDGDLPDCLWSMPKLTLIHAASNGLGGRLPHEFNVSTLLQTVDLSRNQLTGELPVNLFSVPSLQSFDVSNNRIWGRLPDEANESVSTNLSELNLYVNQLSCSLSAASSISVKKMSILAGNLWSCPVPSSVESSDEDGMSYICGDEALLNSVYFWIVSCLLVIVSFLSLYCLRDDFGALWKCWNIASLRSHNLSSKWLNLKSVMASVGDRIRLKLVSGVVILGLLSLVYVSSPSDYSCQITWVASITVIRWSTVVCVVLFSLITCIIVARTWVGVKRNSQIVRLSVVGNEVKTSFSIFNPRFLFVVFLLIGLSIGANIAFVTSQTRNDVSRGVKSVAQYFLSFFRIFLTSWLTPKLMWWVGGHESHVNGIVFLNIINIIVLPIAVSFFLQKSCINDLIDAPETEVTIALDICSVRACDYYAEVTDVLKYTSPFIYSYNCLPTIIRDYSPVLILSSAMSQLGSLAFLVIPLITDVSKIPKWLMTVFPSVWLISSPFVSGNSVDVHDASIYVDNDDAISDQLVALSTNTALFLTFGLTEPLVGLSILSAALTSFVVWRMIIGRLVNAVAIAPIPSRLILLNRLEVLASHHNLPVYYSTISSNILYLAFYLMIMFDVAGRDGSGTFFILSVVCVSTIVLSSACFILLFHFTRRKIESNHVKSSFSMPLLEDDYVEKF